MEQRKLKKKSELSEAIRMKIIDEHFRGKGYKAISKQLQVPVTTVACIVRKVKYHGSVANLPGRGRKRKIDPKVHQKIVQMVKREPNKTSKEIQAALQDQGTSVSGSTVRRYLRERGFKGRRTKSAALEGEKQPKTEPAES